jgi:hypothetical protein
VGLLATEATVASRRYEELVHAYDAGVEVISVPAPRLVPLIEGPDPFGEETTEAVREVAAPLKEAGVDTVILGCTHYPIVRPVFQRAFGRSVTLVFSADETAREVSETLERKGIENGEGREGSIRFLTTGDPDDGDTERPLEVRQPRRGRRVARDDDELHPLLLEASADLEREAAHLVERTGAVRQPCVVAEIDRVLVRQRHEQLVEDGQPSHPGVEHADRPAVHRPG